jgi:hypothetical protein
MANDPTRPNGDRNRPAVKAVSILIVSPAAVVTGGQLSCDHGEFHTLAVASPDDASRIVLAGTPRDLRRIVRAALDAVDHELGG